MDTPCVGICTLDHDKGYCVGCGRTLREIAVWASLSKLERLAIMNELPARRHEQER